MTKKKLDVLYESRRTIFASQENIQDTLISNAPKNIGFFVTVISFITELQYIGFCHDKTENFSINKVSTDCNHSIRNFMFTKVISTDKNRLGVLY